MNHMFHNTAMTAFLGIALLGSPLVPASAKQVEPSIAQLEANRLAASQTENLDAVLALALAGGAVVGTGYALQKRRASGVARGVGHAGRSNPKLQRRLLRLLHEDQATASRLLAQAELKNPGRPQNWYLEKVIYDLERDRGRI